MTVSRQTDILIVGGGLAGLRLADLLHAEGRDFFLVERRNRLGGRIHTHHAGGSVYDLGPAWFWDGQPRMAAQVARFALPVFEQYAVGDFRYEDAQGRIQQGHGYGSMRGSYRLQDGLTRLTGALAHGLPTAHVQTGHAVTGLQRKVTGITATLENGEEIVARKVALALPPRLAAQIVYAPALDADTLRRMQAVPTWMAGQAKALAFYNEPFWRNQNLSGDAMSQRGPMVEIHDASPATGGPFALFGFIGVPPAARLEETQLRHAVLAQVTRLFGAAAAHPLEIVIKDWAFDPATATQADHAPLTAHPSYGLPAALRGLWNDQLVFAGSEVAQGFGGFLEGALEATEMAFAHLSETADKVEVGYAG